MRKVKTFLNYRVTSRLNGIYQRGLYMYLYEHMDRKTNTCHTVSNDKMCRDLKTTQRTIKKNIDEMVEAGVLKVIVGDWKKKLANVYMFPLEGVDPELSKEENVQNIINIKKKEKK